MARPIVGDFVTPTVSANIPSVSPPHPWDNLIWPEGATLSLAAGQGLGKSTITMMLNGEESGFHIGTWFSTEQDPYQVAALSKRLGVKPPPIWTVEMTGEKGAGFESARRGLAKLVSKPGSVTVFDSLTPLGVIDGARMMNLLIADARQTGRRVLMINQTNKAEQVAGSAQLMFMPDIDARIRGGDFGRRKLVVGKNRYGPEFTKYFDIMRNGDVILPDFTKVVHSVEGKMPGLALVPYGLASGSIPGKPGQARGKTVQWAGILDVLAEFGLLTQFAGYACAGFESLATPSGLQYPEDWPHRKAFAHEHNLKWLDEETILAALVAAGWTHPAIRSMEAKEKKRARDGEEPLPAPPVNLIGPTGVPTAPGVLVQPTLRIVRPPKPTEYPDDDSNEDDDYDSTDGNDDGDDDDGDDDYDFNEDDD